MIQIRKEQKDVFDQMAEESFISRLVTHLRHGNQEISNKPEAELRYEVFVCVDEGRSYGFSSEYELAMFSELRIVHKMKTDEPLNKATLESADQSGKQRIERLLDLNLGNSTSDS